jgi:hypothetical protein
VHTPTAVANINLQRVRVNVSGTARCYPHQVLLKMPSPQVLKESEFLRCDSVRGIVAAQRVVAVGTARHGNTRRAGALELFARPAGAVCGPDEQRSDLHKREMGWQVVSVYTTAGAANRPPAARQKASLPAPLQRDEQ